MLLEDTPLSSSETYQALVRSLHRRQGFNLIFVRCTPAQTDRIIQDIHKDLSQYKTHTLQLEPESDNVYAEITQIPDYQSLNIVFIKGLEAALLRYEEAESKDYYLPSQSPVYGGTWAGIPKILGKLNLARERFYQDFPCALVFFLPEFALRYFIRRAPDFFDWKSGVFIFPIDKEMLDKEIHRLVYLDSDVNAYEKFTPQQRLERLAEIKTYLTESPDITPEQGAILWLKKGFVYTFGEEYEEALASFEQALTLQPDDARAWNNRGIALYLLGRYEEALEAFDKAVTLQPDDARAWNNRGIALANLGRYEEALEAYAQALTLQPDNASAWYGKSCCYALKNNLILSLDNLQQAIKLDPSCRDIAKNDQDFTNIRDNIYFQKIINLAN